MHGRTRCQVVAEKADRTALSPIAVQHADGGYSRRGNFGVSFLFYLLAIHNSLTDRTARSMIGYWRYTVVCLSICL